MAFEFLKKDKDAQRGLVVLAVALVIAGGTINSFKPMDFAEIFSGDCASCHHEMAPQRGVATKADLH